MSGRLGKYDRIAFIYTSTLVHVYLSTTYEFSPGPFSPFGLYTICGRGLDHACQKLGQTSLIRHLRGKEDQHMPWAPTSMGRTTGRKHTVRARP